MTAPEMMNGYERFSAVHTYALGFVQKHLLYAVILDFEELSRYCELGRESSKRGGRAKIRIRLTSAERAELIERSELIGSEDLLTKDPNYNRGENFERELTERWTPEKWVKDSVPFWVKGDINVNGVEIQVKLDGAELTNERTISKLMTC